MKVRSGRRSSTFGDSRRISRNPWRSQNSMVVGQLLAGDHGQVLVALAASTAASIRAGPRRRGPGGRGRRRTGAGTWSMPTGSSTRAPTSSPSRLAISPPWWRAASASISSVSLSAAAGGSSAGLRVEGRQHHGAHLRGRLRTDRTHFDSRGKRHPVRSRSTAAVISWSSSALTRSCRSRITMWPASSHSSSREPGMRSWSLRECPIEVSLSAVPQMIEVGHPAQHLDVVELVQAAEAREEVGDHLERRRGQHVVDELDVRPAAPRRRTRTGRWRPSRSPGRRGARRRPARCAAPQGRDRPVGEAAGEPGGQHRQQDPARVEAAGGGGDQADADHAVAEQLGELLGQRDDRHAAHRVPDQDHVAVGHHVRRSPA